ncbi:glycerol-3-phosphate dehydrogenase/oxidase [Labrenzia sp. PHM005]|uniref:glycerol-3-phosphate dehydrogenase/oxidase n=1 Tax=Labrenzia sp. PHM005 TaxID=2590016 RepID=UPI0011407501|nr:glycerol-3-phosphate dehydrogenase/oxidase [Labrenzia sp. PHM005]QDG76178.1 glycerol-3-phosphate dehydrogenase/oxidase [Labrenzia sp. PHM005]
MSDQRQENWGSLRSGSAFDVIVVGGGINGIGVYRELALQGLRVLLVERNDFCSGCSAAPSRMIHGGLRYLENGEFDLVRESLRERDALLKNAPHLVHPLPTVIPIKSVFSGLLNSAASFFGLSGQPSSRGALPIKLGLMLYDWVTRSQRLLPKHMFQGKKATRARWPKLIPDLRFSAVYHDAWISHPERLGIELISDVQEQAPNCVALNYVEVGARQSGGFDVQNLRTGEAVNVSARLVVNATGAWLDETIRQISGETKRERLVSGTKGSHLIIDNDDLADALDGHMVYFENADGRVCIVFPYLGKVLAGSTDIRVKSAARVRCEDDERDYILESLRLVFPGIAVRVDQIVFSYAGIRPLPKSDHDYTGRISRGHFTKRLEGPVPQLCMVGGKWTTFRAFAEQTADEVLAEFGRPRQTNTLGLPIGGGQAFPKDTNRFEIDLINDFAVQFDRARHLVRTYGAAAVELQKFCFSQGNDQLIPGCALTKNEVIYLIRNEFVETVSDLVLRRTSLAIDGSVSLDIIDQLTALLRQERSLSPQEAERQRSDLIEELGDYHGVSKKTLEFRNQNWSEECELARKPA